MRTNFPRNERNERYGQTGADDQTQGTASSSTNAELPNPSLTLVPMTRQRSREGELPPRHRRRLELPENLTQVMGQTGSMSVPLITPAARLRAIRCQISIFPCQVRKASTAA